jgi:hypothetical protein
MELKLGVLVLLESLWQIQFIYEGHIFFYKKILFLETIQTTNNPFRSQGILGDNLPSSKHIRYIPKRDEVGSLWAKRTWQRTHTQIIENRPTQLM